MCFMVLNVYSQTDLNAYKYVIVPKKYDFLKQADHYQINSLSKFLFEKYGFETLMEGDNYPQDLIQNRCLALKSDLLKESGLFKTKLKIELTNCNDQIVYTSPTGESREKEFKVAYHEATRAAFEALEALNYKYQPQKDALPTKVQPVLEVKKDVIQEVPVPQNEAMLLKQSQSTQESIPVTKTETAAKTSTLATIEKQKTPLAQLGNVALSDILYAQVIDNGFQLVDNTPKVICVILKTGVKDVFLVKNESAIIYKQDNNWLYETIVYGTVKQKKLNIKF